MLVLDTSPGTEEAIGLIHPRAFQEADRAGVIGVRKTAQVLQPLTEDRDGLAAALQRAGIRVGVTAGAVQLNNNLAIDLVAALNKACAEFARRGSASRKRVIVVLFGTEDPNLRSHLDALEASLKAADARLYAIMTPRIGPQQARPFPSRIPNTGAYLTPVVTAGHLSELAASSGGRIFRRNWDLKEILEEGRKQ